MGVQVPPQVVVRLYLEDFILLLALVFIIGMCTMVLAKHMVGDD